METGAVRKFDEWAEHPPVWMRLVAVPLFALVALGLASRRGWVVGVIAGVVYGVIALCFAVVPDGTAAWSRRHPILDGAVLGPLVFLALAYIAPWPLWLCLAIGAMGVAVGAAQGAQRARRRAAAAHS